MNHPPYPQEGSATSNQHPFHNSATTSVTNYEGTQPLMHHHTEYLPSTPRRVAATVLATIAVSTAFAGQALGAPDEGQPGVTPPSTTDPGGQPGVTPTPEPAPAPEPAPTPAPEPVPEYGSGIAPSPQWETAPVIYTEPVGPSTAYTPLPEGPLHAPVPTAPVAPKLVEDPAAKIRIGSEVFDRPADVPPEYAITINEYAAWAQAKLAQGFKSVGFNATEAEEKAAAAVLGGVIGGVAGAVALGAPVGVATLLFTAPAGAAIGATIGSFMPPQPLNIGTGALIGLGAGAGVAAVVGGGAAIVGGTAGAIIGAALGYALGAGDPNADPAAPWEDAPTPVPPAPLPNPEGNQYQLVLDAPAASDAGLPAVDYTVNTAGDVSFSTNVAGLPPISGGWTAGQAEAPLQALGPLEQPAKDAIAGATKQIGDGLTQVVNGLHITYPQTIAPAPAV